MRRKARRPQVARAARVRVFVDLRNVYEPVSMREKGFEYAGVGR
jgi:hypothetical protein